MLLIVGFVLSEPLSMLPVIVVPYFHHFLCLSLSFRLMCVCALFYPSTTFMQCVFICSSLYSYLFHSYSQRRSRNITYYAVRFVEFDLVYFLSLFPALMLLFVISMYASMLKTQHAKHNTRTYVPSLHSSKAVQQCYSLLNCVSCVVCYFCM